MLKHFTKPGTLAVCLAYSIALVPGNTSPLIVGGLIGGLDLGIADAGLVLSCELILMGIAATFSAPWMANGNARTAAIAGAIVLLSGHALAAGASGFTEILAWRALAGTGAGIVLAAVNASIAGAPNPPRLYGLALMAPPLLGFVITLLMSHHIAAAYHAGAYGVLAVFTLLVLPWLFFFPDYRKTSTFAKADPLTRLAPGIALLLAIFITGASMMAYFAFVERLGVRLELSTGQIGNIFAWVVLGGAAGAGIAAALDKRFGLVKPLILGILVHSSSMILALQLVTLPAYVLGTVLEGITLVYILTFFFALAARLDPFGRWAAAAGGAFSLSLGAGPYLGGLIIQYAGFGALTLLIVICTLTVLTLLAWIARHSQMDSVTA